MKRKYFAYPYIVWMILFIAAPMLFIFYYAVNVDGVWYMVPKLDGFDPVEITPGHFGGTRLYYGDGSIELRNGEEYSLRNRNTREYAYDFPAGRYRWVISLDGETYAAEFTLERDNVA